MAIGQQMNKQTWRTHVTDTTCRAIRGHFGACPVQTPETVPEKCPGACIRGERNRCAHRVTLASTVQLLHSCAAFTCGNVRVQRCLIGRHVTCINTMLNATSEDKGRQ